jgi:hypothetical protein
MLKPNAESQNDSEPFDRKSLTIRREVEVTLDY